MRLRIILLVVAISSLVLVSFLVPLALLLRTFEADRAVSAGTIQAQFMAPLVATLDTRQLGLAVARALAAEGANVSICGRDPARLVRAHVEFNAMGTGDVLSIPVDLRDEQAAADWVRRTADTFGALDIVVTNTGGVPFGPVDSFQVADYRTAIDENLLPHVSVTLAALPLLKQRGWGRMLMIASEAEASNTSDSDICPTAFDMMFTWI